MPVGIRLSQAAFIRPRRSSASGRVGHRSSTEVRLRKWYSFGGTSLQKFHPRRARGATVEGYGVLATGGMSGTLDQAIGKVAAASLEAT